ncbi:MAG: hypothetical protein IPG72_14440 [Ardenticatenales bacterium]|nr:hypothetical protein [Ardenticatenales bacterium]
MNPSQLKETVFSLPETEGGPTPFANRNLFRVTVEDAPRRTRWSQLWMGASRPRKARLMAIWDGRRRSTSWRRNSSPGRRRRRVHRVRRVRRRRLIDEEG